MDMDVVRKSIVLILLGVLAFSFNYKQVKPCARHLRSKTEVEYYLNPEASALTETSVRKTFENWQKVTDFSFRYLGRNRAGINRDNKNTVSFLKKWPLNLPQGKIAYCYNWYNAKGHIEETDIVFNMSLTRFTTLKTQKPGAYYIEGVLTHEIGHMLGLEHINNKNSLMKQVSTVDESFFKGEIDEITLNSFHALYRNPL